LEKLWVEKSADLLANMLVVVKADDSVAYLAVLSVKKKVALLAV